MTTPIYVVVQTDVNGDLQDRQWFWNEFEAGTKYTDWVEDNRDDSDVYLWRLNIDPYITEVLERSHGELSKLGAELRRSHEAPKEAAVEYTTLESRNGVLSIERSEGSDVWQYRVTNRLQNQWAVFETLSDERIGYVYFTTEDGLPTFEVSDRRTGDAEVNRDSLQAAVEYIIERDISGE